ncbi:MAG: CpsD/CapB family tyrosine-protein kinase [Phycisphaerae bacterium]|nr:CpsD/CapB family tyrosine-protein kinase [Phycisphaerae bacterium]
MGRIADALKRAQLERARHTMAGGVVVEETPGSRFAGAPAGADPRDSLVAASFTSTPFSSLLTPPEPSATPMAINPPPRPAFTATLPPIPREDIHAEVLAFHDPASPITEKYRSVRTRLLTSNPGGSTRVYSITSAASGEGKTITAANLGFSLAELRHLRVAIVDLNFRNRGLSRLFQCDKQPGIADVLRGEKTLAEVCAPMPRPNLHFIGAGDCGTSGPSDLLSGGRVAEAFREIGERFHYTLVDTPPISAFADIGLIAPLCHYALIVIRMNKTPEPLLRRCVKLLQANHIAIAGSILTGYTEEAMSCGENQDYYLGGM